MSFLNNIFKGQFLVPKGTGGATAMANKSQNILDENRANTAPMRDLFTQAMRTGSTSGLPSAWQTPDWQKTQGDVFSAYSTLGDKTATDLFSRNNAAMATDQLKRGNLYGSSGANSSFADLLDWYDTEKKRSGAEALTQSLGVGQNLRQEGSQNWWDMLKYLSDPSQASAYGNVGGQYAEIGKNSTEFQGQLMKLLATMGAGA